MRVRPLTGKEAASEGTSPTGDSQEIMWYATQARDSYPYYQHSAIGYNYRMSNICAGIGRGQMTVADEHIAHHKHKQPVYKDAPAYVNGVSEELFKVGMCLPAGPCVTDEDVRYIVQCIKDAIEDEG